MQTYDKTISIWNYFSELENDLKNPFYKMSSSRKLLQPRFEMKHLRFWKELYLSEPYYMRKGIGEFF